MICYLDTSALVKLYVAEDGSGAVRELVAVAVAVATSRVAYAEARAALARGAHEGILDEAGYRLAVGALEEEWGSYLAVGISDHVLKLAGELAEEHELRGFDALHLASALVLKRQVKLPVALASWDARLWEAARAIGFQVVPETRPGAAGR